MKTKHWLLAACAAAGIGCGSSDSTQVVTGKVSASSAVAVRAVSSGAVITAARVRSDGTFTLSLPAGNEYSLEVMTTTGSVLPIANKSGGSVSALAFKVCQPQDPWDMGGVGTGNQCPPPPPPPCDPKSDPTCVLPPPPPPPPGCTPPPPPCDPATDPDCKLPPPPCDPATDPSCTPPPPPCDPTTDPDCKLPPPPCDPATDPDCKLPPPPCDPATDSNCKPPPPPCDPTTDSSCQVPPPPCADPNDPSTCKDPCMVDPSQCACGSASGSGSGDTCWPPPLPPGDCDGGMAPDHPPGDFGCQGSGSS